MTRAAFWTLTAAGVLLAGCGGGDPTTPPVPAGTAPAADCGSRAPVEQPASVRRAVTFHASPPAGFAAAIGWVNATLSRGGRDGAVRVRSLRLWENDGGQVSLIGERIVCSACEPKDRVFGYSLPRSQWQVESAWAKDNEGTKFGVDNGAVVVPVQQRPDDVFHFWHAHWPRPAAKSTATYFVTAEVDVSGDAMVQIGFDFWRFADRGSEHVEAAVSDWHCAQATQTVRAGAGQ